MMGLLSSNFEDPKTQGLLTLGLALLNGRGNFGQALSQAGQQAMGAYQGAQDRRSAGELRDLQRQQILAQLDAQKAAAADAQRARAREDARAQALRDSMTPAQTLPLPATMDNGDVGAPGSPSLVQPGGLDLQRYLSNLIQAGDPSALQVMTLLQKETPAPLVLGEGASAIDPRTGRVIAANPKPEKDDRPTEVREYEFARSQGYTGTFEQFKRSMKEAGASRVNTHVNAVRPLTHTVAEGLGQQLDASLSGANSAVGTIRGARDLRAVLDTGKVVTGPGANAEILARQLGERFGVGGKDNAEILANTRRAIQNLAAAELKAAEAMKGQGAITDTERELLRRAASGDITMTTTELRALSDVMERTAQARITGHQRNVERMRAIPEMAQLIPFYAGPEVPGAPPRQGNQPRPSGTVDFNSLPR